MQSTSASYVGLRALLLKDLPNYICLLHRSMAILVKYLADIQKRFWKDMSDKWGELWGMLRVDGEINAGVEETINVWAARWTDVDEVISSLNVCMGSKIYQEPERARRRTASGVSDVSASPPGASVWVSSPMAFARAGRSRSRNSQESSHRLRRGTSSHSRERWPEPQRGRTPTPPAGLHSPARSPTAATQGKLSAQMPSAPNGKPLRSSRKYKSHKSTSSDKPKTRNPVSDYNIPSGDADQWALKPAKYGCRVIHFFNPPAEARWSYLSFPFFLLHVGVLYDVLHEAGHPDTHPKLPFFVDEGEDCLLLCRSKRGEVGWALASFLEPVDTPLT